MTRPEDLNDVELLAAMSKLTMNEREVLIDHEVRFETYESIAQRLGMTKQGCASLCTNAKRKLERWLAHGR